MNSLPLDWKLSKVSQHVDITTGGRDTQDKIENGRYQFFVRSNNIERIDSYSFDGEGVLTAGDGVGTGKVFHYIDGKFDFHQRVYLMSKFDDELYGRFFYQYFKQNFIYRVQKLSAKGSVDSVRMEMIAGMDMPLPPYYEQKKISDIIESVEAVIEKTQAQIDKLKDLKTGMMQELLTKGVDKNGERHTKFKDSPMGRIPVGWDVLNVEDLIDVMEAGWSPQCESKSAQIGEWGVLKTTAVQWTGFDYSANKKLPSNLDPRENIQVVSKDILITRAGPAERVGVVCYVEYVPDKILLSDKIIRIKANEKIDPKFFSIWLSSDYVKNFFSVRVSGLAQSQTNISQNILKSVPCVLPSYEEQKRISESVSSIEIRLAALVKKYAANVQLKKALMQDLLTGKVRVQVD